MSKSIFEVSLRTKKTFPFGISFLLLFILVSFAHAQSYRANRWAFPNLNGLNFSGATVQPITTALTGSEGTAAISDENGDFIFYSNGNKVWQANGTIMSGVNNLEGDPEATQACLIVPARTSPTRYYLFVNDAAAGPFGFQYYDVEMTLNGGNGGVVGPTTLLDTATEKMAATRHANDLDYWVVAHKWNSDEFHAFLVDENGVNINPVISAVGIPHLNSSGAGEETGQMKISPDGSWIVTCNFNTGVQLFRFNNETGEVSDPITLASGASIFPYGAAFSADSKKLYYSRRASNATNPYGIHQFDLDHASVDCLLASEIDFSNNDPFKLYSHLQLGIDKRIYVAYFKPSPFNADTLGVIEHPDEMCPDCGYVNNELLVNNGMIEGLPNFVSSFVSDGMRYEFGTNCEDDSTVFWPEDTLGLDSVRWNFGDPSTGAANTSNSIPAYHVFSNAPDTFLVTLHTFRGNNIDTFTRNVIVWDTAVDLLGRDTTLCTGQSITLDATWYDACVIWDDSSTNLTYTTNQEGYHGVTVFHQSCVWRDSVYVKLVTTPPQFTLGNDTSVCADVNFVIDPDLQDAFYTWQDGSHDTTFAVSSTGTYWLQASNACGSNTDTLNVILNEAAQPVLHFPDDTTGCDTIGIALDVTFDDAVYLWNDGQTAGIRTITEPGTYWVQVGNSCDTVRDTIDIFLDSPLFSALEPREVVCSNTPWRTLELLATPDSQVVNWNTGEISTFIELNDEDGTYWFTQSNACGTTSDNIEVLAYDTNYELMIGGDTTLCDGGLFLTIGDTADDFPWEYSWSSNQSTPMIQAGVGIYQVTASHRCDTLEVRTEISAAPRIFIKDSLTRNICQGDTLLIQLSTDAVVESTWSSGETGTSVVIVEPGDYFVTVKDSFGCVQTDSIGLGDLCPGIVDVPNVFTPGGDGLNDEFCLDLINIVEFEFTIYNRWGQEVFYSMNETTCWNGEVQGIDAPSGTYFYVLRTLDGMEETASFRGSLTLIRE